METYDPSKIGPRISIGVDHWVYKYGEAEVIKFSFLGKYLVGEHASREIRVRQLKLAQEYFPEFLLPSRYATSPDGYELCLMQPYIVGRVVMPEDMDDPRLRDQLQHLIDSYYKLLSDVGTPIDLTGQEGIFKGLLGNIWIVNNKLKIFDITLLEARGSTFNSILQLLVPAFIRRQNAIIGRYLTKN